jgi:hypothetical protein
MSPFPHIIGAMRSRLAYLIFLLPPWHSPSFAQCAPAPDSPYFFRSLAEQRAEAKLNEDRAFFEDLLSANFAGKDPGGKTLPKEQFIDSELAAKHVASRQGFYSIRNFSLVEHRKGLAITSYLLVEGDIGEGKTNARQVWQREIFEVQDGKWRLVSIEDVPPRAAQHALNQPGD